MSPYFLFSGPSIPLNLRVNTSSSDSYAQFVWDRPVSDYNAYAYLLISDESEITSGSMDSDTTEKVVTT